MAALVTRSRAYRSSNSDGHVWLAARHGELLRQRKDARLHLHPMLDDPIALGPLVCLRVPTAVLGHSSL